MSTRGREGNTCCSKNTFFFFGKLYIGGKNSHVPTVQFRKRSFQTLARAKVPWVQKSWQQQEPQTRDVSTIWKDLEGWDKEQAIWMTAQCETSSVSVPPALHGCQWQKTLHHTASGSRAWWTPTLTLLPQETVPPGHGWGKLARVTVEGMQVQLPAQNSSSNQQSSASRGCQAGPSPAYTEQ